MCSSDLEASRADRERSLAAQACRAIERAEQPPKLAELATLCGLSPYHFHRLFKRITGVTPRAYAAAHRQGAVQRELTSGSSVTEAMYAAGFGSSGRFYEASEAMLGMRPSAYRSGGGGESVWYATGRCSLGRVLVAATARGVCAISLGDSGEALATELRERFPKARFVKAPKGFEASLRSVLRFLDLPSGALELPLDIRGTAFQRRVWEALRRIPAGKTASYTELAGKIGKPSAVRAVASACAANPLAVAIPCHRAVRGNGALAGYRWGIERKRKLLAREAK